MKIRLIVGAIVAVLLASCGVVTMGTTSMGAIIAGSYGGGAASSVWGSVGALSSAVPAQYRDLVQKAGQICASVTAPAIAAQIEAESNWDPNSLSPTGAVGIGQFQLGTWQSLGIKGSPADPTVAIPAMGKYMCQLAAEVQAAMKVGKITRGTLQQNTWAAYNAGLGAVEKSHGYPTGIAETDAYVPRIQSLEAKYTAAVTNTLTGATGPADLSSNGPCPLGPADTGVTCNQAIAYAQAHMGESGWSGRCLNLVTLAYGGQYSGIGAPTYYAVQSAQAVQAAGLMQPPTTDYGSIPRGAIVWFSSSHPAGHVVISVGGGQAISTDAPNNDYIGIVPIAFFIQTWHQTMIGWSPPRV